jgi:hypothetical protein
VETIQQFATSRSDYVQSADPSALQKKRDRAFVETQSCITIPIVAAQSIRFRTNSVVVRLTKKKLRAFARSSLRIA